MVVTNMHFCMVAFQYRLGQLGMLRVSFPGFFSRF
jgi:carboxylesterase type B